MFVISKFADQISNSFDGANILSIDRLLVQLLQEPRFEHLSGEYL